MAHETHGHTLDTDYSGRCKGPSMGGLLIERRLRPYPRSPRRWAILLGRVACPLARAPALKSFRAGEWRGRRLGDVGLPISTARPGRDRQDEFLDPYPAHRCRWLNRQRSGGLGIPRPASVVSEGSERDRAFVEA